MEAKQTGKLNLGHEEAQNKVTKELDDASKLWKQYQKQKDKKKLGACFLFFFVVLIIVILVIVGLYIVYSTTDPLNSL